MQTESWGYLIALNPKRFKEQIVERFGIDPNVLTKLLQEFMLVPREDCVPQDDDAVPGTMTDIARYLNLPVRVVGRLQDIGVISRPMTYADLGFMEKIRQIWGNHFLLRSQIAELSVKQREELIRRPELAAKWERYAYKVFLTNQIDYGDGGRMLNPENRIRIVHLASLIAEMFNVLNSPKLHERLRKIREIAHNDRKRAQAENSDLEEMSRRRGVKLDNLDDP